MRNVILLASEFLERTTVMLLVSIIYIDRLFKALPFT